MLQNVVAFLLLTLFITSIPGCKAQLADGVASEDSSSLAAMAMPLVMPMLSAGFKIFSGANDDAVVTTHDAGATNWASSLIPLVIPLVKTGLSMFNEAINAGGSLGSLLRANSKNVGVPSNMDYPLRSTPVLGDTGELNGPGNVDLAAATSGGGLGRLLGGTLAKIGADFLANLNSHGNVDPINESGGLGGLLSLAQLVASMANPNGPETVDQASKGSGGLGDLLNLAQMVSSMANLNEPENVDQASKESGGLGGLLSLAQLASTENSNSIKNMDQESKGNGGLGGLLNLAQKLASMSNSEGPEKVSQAYKESGGLGGLLSLAQLASMPNSNGTEKVPQAANGSNGGLGGLLNLVKLESMPNLNGTEKVDQTDNGGEGLRGLLNLAQSAIMANLNRAENMDQSSNGGRGLDGLMNLAKLGASIAHSNEHRNIKQTSNKQESLDAMMSLGKFVANMASSNIAGKVNEPVNKNEGLRKLLGELDANMSNSNEIGNINKATKGIGDIADLLSLAKLEAIANSKVSGDQPANGSEGLKSLLGIAKLGASMLNTISAKNMDQAVTSGSLGDIISLGDLMSLAKAAMADSYGSEYINQPAKDSERLRSFLGIGNLGANMTNYNETENMDLATRGTASLALSKLGNSTGNSVTATKIDQVAVENDDSKDLLVLGKLGANIMANSSLPSHMEKLIPSTRKSNESGVSNTTEIPFLLRSSPSDNSLGSTAGALSGFGNQGGGLSKLLKLFKLGASMASSDASSKTDLRLRNNPIEVTNRSENFNVGKFMSLFKDMGDTDHGLASVPSGKVVQISREIRNKLVHTREEMEREREKELEEEELENKIETRAKQFICKETEEGRKCMWSIKNVEHDNDK